MTANSPSNANDLYERLQQREYCHGLGLPETEKSRLLEEVQSRLTGDGVRWAVIELERGLQEDPDRTNSEQDWYLGFISDLARQFSLVRNPSYINFREDANNREHLENAQELLRDFVWNILLPEIQGNIVILIDQLDSLLSLDSFSNDFTNKFLVTLETCHRQRATAPQENNFNRLTFAVFGTEAVLTQIGTHPLFTEILKINGKNTKLTQLQDYVRNTLQEIEINTPFGSMQGSRIVKIIQDLFRWIRSIFEKICNWILSKFTIFKKKIKQIPKWLRITLIILFISGLFPLSVIFVGCYEQWSLNRQANRALETFKSQEIESLEIALKAANSLKQIQKENHDMVITKPLEALQTILNQIHEKNRLSDKEHQNQITAVVFNPSGSRIATGGLNGTLLLWDTSGKLLKSVNTEQRKIFSLSFSSNGELIATGGEDGSVKLWDSKTLEGKQTPSPCNSQPIRALSFGNYDQENYLAAGGDDGKVCLWEITNIKSELRFKPLLSLTTDKPVKGNIYSISFKPNSKNIAIGRSDGSIEIINFVGGRVEFWWFNQNLSSQIDLPFNISFNSSGTKMGAAGKEGTVKLWEWLPMQNSDNNKPNKANKANSWKEINSWNLYQNPGENPFSKVYFTDDDKLLAIAENEKLEIWELLEQKGDKNRKLLAELKGYGIDKADNNQAIPKDKLAIVSASFNPKTKNLVTTTEENQVRFWELSEKDKPTWTFSTKQGRIKSLSVRSSSNNTLTSIATLDESGKVKLWPVAIKGQEIDSKALETQEKFTSISFVPNEDLIATANKSGVLQFWNLQGEKMLADVPTGLREITSISFKTDHRIRIVAAADINGAIEFWDWRAIDKKDTVISHQKELESMIFIEANKLPILITIGKGKGNIKSWDFFIEGSQQGIRASQKQINLVNQLHNLEYDYLTIGLSQWVIAKAQEVQIRDQESGNLLGKFSSNLNEITSISLSPDGKYLVAGGDDGRVQVWLVSLEDLLRKGCEWLRDYYTNSNHLKPEVSKACPGILSQKSAFSSVALEKR